MAKLNPFKFMQEVRQEVNKVTWPSRKETGITTAMVFVFAAVAAVFFLLAGQVIRMFVTLVLGIGGLRGGQGGGEIPETNPNAGKSSPPILTFGKKTRDWSPRQGKKTGCAAPSE